MVTAEYGGCHRTPLDAYRNQLHTAIMLAVSMDPLQFSLKGAAGIGGVITDSPAVGAYELIG
jgi:hypothetical protein